MSGAVRTAAVQTGRADIEMSRTASITAVVLALWSASSPVPAAQTAAALSAFVGRWQIDSARTSLRRGNLSRSATFTFIFVPQGAGLKLDIYENYPQSMPTRSATIVPDRHKHGCENPKGCQTVGGDPAEQSYAYFQIDPHLLIRVFYTRDVVTEYTTYAVSADGKTFTLISWGSDDPEKQNIQVFDRKT
jgi:hypothetical protein